jgi:hypothetical protein
MSYILYKSNGQRLVTVVDGSIDKATTDLTFVGKNYAGYGEILNQNMAKLLENFANTTEPTKPMIGQLWYDSSTKKLNLYDGARFKAIPNFDSKTSTPLNNSKGDFWYDETIKKLKFYDGTKFVTIGPADAAEFNNVQLVAATIIDNNDLEKTVLKFEIADGTGDIRVPAVVSRDTFEPSVGDTLKSEFDYNVVQRGISLPGATIDTGDSTSLGYYFWGTAGTALGLVEKVNTTYTYHAATEYLRRVDFDSAINDGIDIPADYGLTVGLGRILQIHADSNTFEGKISAVNGNSISVNLQYQGALKNVITFSENNIIPNTAINMNIGTTNNRFATVWAGTATVTRLNSTISYANTFTGSLVGNVTGNVTGNLTGSIVTATTVNAGTLNVTNITLTGQVSGSVSGNVTTSLISAAGGTEFSPAQIKGQWTLIGSSTLNATYADLAERYEADALYGPGSVLVLGGAKEVTITTERASTAVAGIVSTNPAFKMNSEAGTDESHPYIALKGRVPCKVVGPVQKGELLVTSRKAGYAEAAQMGDSPNAVIGKALEDFEGSDGVIEVKV